MFQRAHIGGTLPQRVGACDALAKMLANGARAAGHDKQALGGELSVGAPVLPGRTDRRRG